MTKLWHGRTLLTDSKAPNFYLYHQSSILMVTLLQVKVYLFSNVQLISKLIQKELLKHSSLLEKKYIIIHT